MGNKMGKMVIFLGALLFSAASIVLCTPWGEKILPKSLVYVIDCSAAVFLTAAVWQLALVFRKAALKDRFLRTVHHTQVTGRLYDDLTFRTMVLGYLSMGANFIFALTKAAAGWCSASSWLLALALYYLALCIAKAVILYRGSKGEKGAAEWKTYRLCGILLLFMTLTLQGIMILIVEQGRSFIYQGNLIFVIALYDFYCLISSIVYMVRTRKRHAPLIVSVKTISFATSLTAMLTLQTAMFASFGSEMEGGQQQRMNIMTGTAICTVLIVWGIRMICRAQKELQKIKEEE